MKIRFYWWIGIIMISFILFYTALIHTKISSELVSDHYYEEEIEYQEIIYERKNAVNFTSFNVQVMPVGIQIHFFKHISGTFNLLRLSNKHLDVARVIHATGKKIIPAYVLKYGTYSLLIRCKYSGKRYFVEQSMKWKI